MSNEIDTGIRVTKEGLDKLKEELQYLKSVKRKEVVEALRVALTFGDISENSEYDEAKNEQAKTEARIAELEETINNAKVVVAKKSGKKTVNLGSRVEVYNLKTKESIEYMLVGSTEADPLENKISDASPIGKALFGKAVGDEVKVTTPAGNIKLRIDNIKK